MREADLEQLYARLEKPLYNVVFRWVWNADEAQDIVQEAFVRLWRMRRRVDTKTVEALVYKIALNLAATRRRTKKLWRWVSIDALRGASMAGGTAEDAMFADEERARVRDAVESLPEDLRRVILLSQYSGLSYDEIAGILRIPAGTVGSRRNRAMQKLKEVLSTEPEGRERPAPETV